MSSLFSCDVEIIRNVAVISCTGYIDAEAVDGLQGAFRKIKHLHCRKLLFDFEKTKKINSTGMSHILHLLQESSDSGIIVKFSSLSRINEKLFSMIGINEYGEILPDKETALHSFSG